MPTILVVEDDPTVLVLASSIIGGMGHQTLTAANGGEAIAIIEGGAPIDFIFTDINLGDGPNGLEIVSQGVV